MASTASNSKRATLLACLMLPALAVAGDWKFTPGLNLSESYSDNVHLDPDGAEESDWVTEIRPSLKVRRQGARLKVEADYSLQGLLYAAGTGDNKLRHQLTGRANAEMVDEWLFLDASARVGQSPVGLASSRGVGGGIAGIDNTTTVGAYSISPYLKHRFGSRVSMEARIEQTGVFIGDSAFSDSDTTRYTLKLVSGNDFFPLSWNVDYALAEQNNRNTSLARDSSTEHASAHARYQLSRKYGLLAQAGMDNNDLPGVSGRAARNFSYYGLGMYYTPGRRFSLDALYNQSDSGDFLSGRVLISPTLRTTLDASLGKRAYGRSYSLGLSHRTRHSNWSLRYQDAVTTWQQLVMGSVGAYICSDGTSGILQPGDFPPPGCLIFGDVVPRDESFISKHLAGSVSYSLRRHSWHLSLYGNRREYLVSSDTDTLTGFQGSWDYKPVGNTTYTLTAGLARNESEGGSVRDDDLWNIGFIARRQFQPKLTGSVEVRHQERTANAGTADDYTENSVTARVNMTF